MEGIRTPRQQRGQEVLERILGAAAELLAEEGHEGFTLADVARRAGVSYGSMQWRIDSKDALLRAVHLRYLAVAEQQTALLRDAERWDGLSILEVVDGAVRAIASVMTHDVRLLRAIALRTGSDPDTADRAARSVQAAGEAFLALVAPRLAAAGHPDARRDASFLFTAVIDALSGRLVWPEYHAGPALGWPRFVDRLAAMACAYVEAAIGEAGPTRPAGRARRPGRA